MISDPEQYDNDPNSSEPQSPPSELGNFTLLNPQNYLSMAQNPAAAIINSEIGKYGKEMRENIAQTQSKIRPLFAVNTKSVLQKLKSLLCPFIVKNWSRSGHEGGQATPTSNPNAPDLYTPLVFAFFFILIISLANIIQDTFSFERVTYTFCKFFIIVVLQVVLSKFLFYIVGFQGTFTIFSLFADLCSVSVHISLCTLFCWNKVVLYIITAYSVVAAFYWTIKTLNSQSGIQTKPKTGQTYSILFVGLIQGLVPLLFIRSYGGKQPIEAPIQIETPVTQ
ncbi:protein YIF1A-like isoform X1 [Histomonas meleagridis]|uniref:protein YIF1A-like isoform X1 n=1 Tax=Histomonas meleagridis TaxID=135588 RepID=UPI00355AADC5|nr:protein YIF1A-like isoform X1 [Histomonas meleagridis]KAH0798421.1 protein YIF1A-like isoform X1 [Histomonas meleagridis]